VLDGDGSLEVGRVAAIDEAEAGDLTFLANPKYASKLSGTRATAVIVHDDVSDAPCAMLRSPNPYLTFAESVAVLTPDPPPEPGISAQAAIDETAHIGADASVGAFVVVGAGTRVGARAVLAPHVVIGRGVTIGDDCVFHAHVSVRDGVAIGSRVVLQNGVVIGSDGFGFARRTDGSHQKIPQVGTVAVEDDVEVGAGSTVDRPAVGETRIGAGTKIDNLVQVGHGTRIGKRVLIAALSGIGGSTLIDDDVTLAGQVGVVGHLRIGRGVVAMAKSGITKDVAPGSRIAGFPARDVDEWLQGQALVRRLSDLGRLVADLTARLGALESRLK
jgi:UDP-3-O-[3-hydroxymyristoyl] glucosamine N-acyltransferase